MSQRAAKVIRAAIVILLLVACSPSAATAQTDTPKPKSVIKRWSISIGGARAGGPASQFEAAMRSAGFNDTSSSFFGPPAVTHPFSTQGGLTEYHLTYLRSDRLALGLVVSRGDLGTTLGYKKDVGSLGLDSDVTVMAPIAYLRFGDNARVGAGPLVAWTGVSEILRFSQSYRSVTGGAMVHAALESNPRRRVYVALNGSYRWIAPVTVGPFTKTSFNSSATLPAMRVNMSHASVGVSLGVRF